MTNLSASCTICPGKCLCFRSGNSIYAFAPGNRALDSMALCAESSTTRVRMEHPLPAAGGHFKRRLIRRRYLLPIVPRVLGGNFCSRTAAVSPASLSCNSRGRIYYVVYDVNRVALWSGCNRGASSRLGLHGSCGRNLKN